VVKWVVLYFVGEIESSFHHFYVITNLKTVRTPLEMLGASCNCNRAAKHANGVDPLQWSSTEHVLSVFESFVS